MDPLLGLFLVILAGSVAVWFNVRQGDEQGDRQGGRQLQARLDAAASSGLQVMEVFGRSGFKARAGPLEVWIADSGQETPRVRIEILIPGSPDFYSVRIRPESFMPAPWVREIEIGDESFDNTFSIEGPIRLVRALFDAEMRRLIAQANSKNRLEISYNRLRTEASDEELPHILPLLIDLGQRFTQSMDIPRRLAEIASRDPEAGVRLQNLLLLIREFPGNPATVEALRTACSDVNPEIRLRAAKELGAEGRGVLLKLAESVENDAVSAQAVSLLNEELAVERLTAILDQALRGHHMQTARVCVKTLGRRGDAAAVGPLTKLVERERGELAAVAAQALGAIGSADAEPPLLQALQYEDTEVRTAAAKALGRVGSAAAVLPLKEMAESSKFGRDLRRAARQAIAEIQSRLKGATPGQLSLAETEAGQLSIATDPVGQLSLASEDSGKLSLSDDDEGLKPVPGGTA